MRVLVPAPASLLVVAHCGRVVTSEWIFLATSFTWHRDEVSVHYFILCFAIWKWWGGATFWSLALACGHSMHPGESISAQSRFAKVFAKVYGNQRGRSTEAHTLFF